MKLTELNPKEKTFKDVKKGECFKMKGRVYICTDYLDQAGRAMSIDLATGGWAFFSDWMEISPIDIEATYEEL